MHKASLMTLNYSSNHCFLQLLQITVLLIYFTPTLSMNYRKLMLHSRNVAILITNFNINNSICQCNYESLSKYAKMHQYLLETHNTNNYFLKLKDLLTDENKKYLVLTLNCDIIVKNFRIKVEYLWEDYATSAYNSKTDYTNDNMNTSMIISRNAHWSSPSKLPFNIASIIWNYNHWTESLIQDVISYTYKQISPILLSEKEGYVDQPALIDVLLQKLGYISSNSTWVSRKRRKPEKRTHSNVKVLGPRKMIGVAPSGDAGFDFGIPEETYWHEGDWLLHVERPVCCEEARLKEMKRYHGCPKLMKQSQNNFVTDRKNISKLSIIVLHTTNATHCNCAQESVENYATKHGYDYYLVTARSKRRIPMSKHIKFEKYALVRELLMYQSKLVLLLDCDVAITNHSIIALDVWKNHTYPTTNLLVSRDAWWQNGVPINTGVLFFRNSTWTHDLLKAVIKKGEIPSKSAQFGSSGDLKDQPRLIKELLLRKEMVLQSNNSDLQFQNVAVVSQRVMNSFKRRGQMYKFDPLESRWRKRDWVLHATGSSTKARYNVMKDKGICPVFKRNKEASEYHDDNSNDKDNESDAIEGHSYNDTFTRTIKNDYNYNEEKN